MRKIMMLPVALLLSAQAALADNVTIPDYVDTSQIVGEVGTKLGETLAAVVAIAVAVILVFMFLKYLKRGVNKG